MKSLLFEEGITLDNIDNISEDIVHSFGKLYYKSLGDSWRFKGLTWSPILTMLFLS